MLARLGDHGADVGDDLDVERDAVAAGFGDLREVVRRVVDHQVAIEAAAERVDVGRERAQHDRADRHGRDEVAVADVEVEDAGPGLPELLDLQAELPEVRRIERGLDLTVRTQSLQPTPRSYDRVRRRATKKPLVRWSSGNVCRNSGRAGCLELRPVLDRLDGQAGGVDDRFGLVRVDRADRVDDRPPGRTRLGRRLQELELELGERLGAPAQVGRAARTPRPGARRVDERAVEARQLGGRWRPSAWTTRTWPAPRRRTFSSSSRARTRSPRRRTTSPASIVALPPGAAQRSSVRSPGRESTTRPTSCEARLCGQISPRSRAFASTRSTSYAPGMSVSDPSGVDPGHV